MMVGGFAARDQPAYELDGLGKSRKRELLPYGAPLERPAIE
jgi:hypothetical protein